MDPALVLGDEAVVDASGRRWSRVARSTVVVVLESSVVGSGVEFSSPDRSSWSPPSSSCLETVVVFVVVVVVRRRSPRPPSSRPADGLGGSPGTAGSVVAVFVMEVSVDPEVATFSPSSPNTGSRG
ncbi:MAG: hypothetical protein R2715_05585 [Ilumatobacteraceae bacterium]